MCDSGLFTPQSQKKVLRRLPEHFHEKKIQIALGEIPLRCRINTTERLSDLLFDERHDPDPGEDGLPTQALSRHTVCKGLGPVGHRLAQVPHEQRHVGSGSGVGGKKGLKAGGSEVFVTVSMLLLLELFLRLAPEVPDQPLRGKGVLRGHPPPHHSVQEGLPLPRVEPQHLHQTAVHHQQRVEYSPRPKVLSNPKLRLCEQLGCIFKV